jgi:hypothetical protein
MLQYVLILCTDGGKNVLSRVTLRFRRSDSSWACSAVGWHGTHNLLLQRCNPQFLQIAQYSVAGQCDSRVNQASGPAAVKNINNRKQPHNRLAAALHDVGSTAIQPAESGQKMLLILFEHL